MKILTLDNRTQSLTELPDEITEDIRFAILDNNNPMDPDFFFLPLIFMETFTSPAILLKIGDHEIAMPIDWSIVVGDSQTGYDLEIMPLTSLIGQSGDNRHSSTRGFEAFVFNPLTSYRLDFQEIEIVNVFNEVNWYFPRIKPNQILATPLYPGENPPCAYFVRDINRQNEIIYIDKIL